MRRVLVPVHHDPGCLPAVGVAVRVARALDLGIDLCHVRDAGAPDAAEVLDRAAGEVSASGLPVGVLRPEGRPGPAIAEAAAGHLLVVMRSQAHRAGGAAHGEVKSTTLDVLRTTPCPVLAVTERTTDLADAVFAYNGSRQSRRAIETALELLAPAVVKRGTVVTATGDPQMAERLMAEFDELAWSKNLNLRKHAAAGRPADVLLQRLRSPGGDLVVMGAQGRSWIKEKIFGSTTNDMLRSSPVPIWMSR